MPYTSVCNPWGGQIKNALVNICLTDQQLRLSKTKEAHNRACSSVVVRTAPIETMTLSTLAVLKIKTRPRHLELEKTQTKSSVDTITNLEYYNTNVKQ